jgi:hypothetical protein
MRIVRGTTPIHLFTIPVTEAELKTVRITYEQPDGLILEKSKGDCTFSVGYLQTKLTQEETYKLDHTLPVRVQLKLQLTSGEVMTSQILTLPVGESLNEEVLQ